MISIAVDFDGTLVEDKFPDIGKPKWSVVRAIQKLQELGARTVLWTCRKDDEHGLHLSKAVEWCEEHGLHFASVNENLPEVQSKWGGDTRKVMVDMYIDDKSMGGFSILQLWMLVEQLEKEKSGV